MPGFLGEGNLLLPISSPSLGLPRAGSHSPHWLLDWAQGHEEVSQNKAVSEQDLFWGSNGPASWPHPSCPQL